MQERGIEQFDYICITGDSYVDHPSFGISIISRVVESLGFTVGIIAQPDWHSVRDFKKLGKPKYAFLVTSGNIDSMVAHYTSAKRKRSDDAYTAGGMAESALTVRSLCTVKNCARLTGMFLLPLAVWRLRFADLRIMITGTMLFVRPYFMTAVLICSCTEWASIR